MIIKMKKVSLIVMDKNIRDSLEKLRELGVFHLEKKEVYSEILRGLLDRKRKLEGAATVINSFAPKDKSQWKSSGEFPDDISTYVSGNFEKLKQAREQINANEKEISRIVAWGNFDPDLFKEVSAGAGGLYPYELPIKSYNKIEKIIDDKKIIVLKKTKSTVYCLSVGSELSNENVWLLPSRSINAIKAENEDLKVEIGVIEKKLASSTYLLPKIEEELLINEEKIEFETAKAGRKIIKPDIETTSSGGDRLNIAFIEGYVPEPELDKLKRGANEAGWALYASDPAENERPPTLTKNNAFVNIIKPLFSFIGTTPGYREYDISPSFLIFFCIFFAMIFGDAAYGALIFIITALVGLSIKMKTGKTPDVCKLFMLLSFSTIVWGAINGSWFAIPYDNLPFFLQAIVLPQFKSDGPLFLEFFKNLLGLEKGYTPSNVARWNVQFLCFSIAVVQLVYSHLKNIKKIIRSKTPAVALAQSGWLVMMIGLYFLVLSMLLKISSPSFTLPLILGGLVLYFLFVEQKGGNPFVNALKGFANFLPTFLNAVGSFADIISYIRLFAVGLAGSAIAGSFNSMSALGSALSGGFSAGELALKIFAAALILVFGHGLNMLMNALSVIVHGVRLNLLEYAGNHLGMEWSGYSYKPFALKEAEGK